MLVPGRANGFAGGAALGRFTAETAFDGRGAFRVLMESAFRMANVLGPLSFCLAVSASSSLIVSFKSISRFRNLVE